MQDRELVLLAVRHSLYRFPSAIAVRRPNGSRSASNAKLAMPQMQTCREGVSPLLTPVPGSLRLAGPLSSRAASSFLACFLPLIVLVGHHHRRPHYQHLTKLPEEQLTKLVEHTTAGTFERALAELHPWLKASPPHPTPTPPVAKTHPMLGPLPQGHILYLGHDDHRAAPTTAM